MRILIADDDPALRTTLADALTRDGLLVEEAEDGAAALDRLFDERLPEVDVLISDIRMPRRSGVDVLSTLRRQNKRLPVVLMTGFGDGARRTNLDPLYPLEVLEKPFDIGALREVLASVSLEETLQGNDSQRLVNREERFVVVADDDREMRELMCDTLRAAGYVVRSAADGRELLALLTATSRGELPRPDAVITDIRMPRCSGLDVVHAMRLAQWDQPVIVVTGFGDPHTHSSATELGATAVLDKPFDSDTLVGFVDVVIATASVADDGPRSDGARS